MSAKYKFDFGDEKDNERLELWIVDKIEKIRKLNRSSNYNEEGFEFPEPRELDMLAQKLTVYSRDPQCFVTFILNPESGAINVKYYSDERRFRPASNNPWWCVAESRGAECGEGSQKISLLPEGDSHSKSIKEYLLKNFVFPRPPTVPASSTKPSRFNFYLPGQVMNRKSSKTRKNQTRKNRKSRNSRSSRNSRNSRNNRK